MTPSEGFTTWITKPDGSTREFYDQQIIEDGQVRNEPGYTTDLWTRKGVEFIQQNKDRPFFLYLAYNGPYSLGKLMLNPPGTATPPTTPTNPSPASRRRHASLAARQQRIPQHPAAMERMAAETSGVDDGVGEIMAALKRLGLDDNTLVVYSADQGWMGGQNGMWGMGDHFRPTGAHELMMQIPLIFRQPGQIPAAQTCDPS
jgi:arylsulfatase A-like enzyme